jgi:putative YphP/YqiW family bacilliredoxin
VPYPEEMVRPMREELTRIGVRELRTREDVEAILAERTGTTLVFVNSVCGCAAGMARPGLALALHHDRLPDRITTVFAGVDTEATARAREGFGPQPATSPQIALFRDGELVHMVQRQDIEGHAAHEVARNLIAAFDRYCAVRGTERV